MDESTPNIKEYIDSLTPSIKQAVLSPDWHKKLSEISQKYGLQENKINDLEYEVLFVMIGVEPEEDLAENIERELGVSKILSSQLTEDINQRILQPILKTLEIKQEAKASVTTDARPIQTQSEFRAKTFANNDIATDNIPTETPIVTPVPGTGVKPDVFNTINTNRVHIMSETGDEKNVPDTPTSQETIKTEKKSSFIDTLIKQNNFQTSPANTPPKENSPILSITPQLNHKVVPPPINLPTEIVPPVPGSGENMNDKIVVPELPTTPKPNNVAPVQPQVAKVDSMPVENVMIGTNFVNKTDSIQPKDSNTSQIPVAQPTPVQNSPQNQVAGQNNISKPYVVSNKLSQVVSSEKEKSVVVKPSEKNVAPNGSYTVDPYREPIS